MSRTVPPHGGPDARHTLGVGWSRSESGVKAPSRGRTHSEVGGGISIRG